ncbi:MAG: DUF1214 domain-containing protein [Alphaproteobacteria bacterium]|nr:DUF1214 domain-containing protein [Alphaproteobacteria bacterium]
MKISLGSAFLLGGAVVGYLTGVNALSRSGQVAADGKWMQGRVDPKNPNALYALGHFRQDGLLPPANGALFYTRLVDDDGNSLRSSCSYQLSGPQPAARWWSVSAGDVAGGKAASFSARDAVLTSDDQLNLALTRRAAPGNWLALPDVGTLRVALVIDEPYPTPKGGAVPLPSIKKLGCE